MGNDSTKLKRSVSVCAPGNRRLALKQRQYRVPSIKVASSPGCSTENIQSENLFSDSLQRRPSSTKSLLEISRARQRNGSTSSTASSSPRLKHPVTYKNRQLVQGCFRNPHEILGRRILKKACEKKPDFAQFVALLKDTEREDLEDNIKVLFKKVVANIEFIDEVQRLSEEFGAHHVQYRKYGFKPEFFGIYADAAVTECTFLDNAVHPSHQTLDAFSSFITLVFSFVRDGYYNEMRRSRRASSFKSPGLTSPRKGPKTSVGHILDRPARSVSPEIASRYTDECFRNLIFNDVDIDYLKPPQPNALMSNGTSKSTIK